jgi:hypothetical protein
MAWNDTKEGAALGDAFHQVQYTYSVRLPGHLQSLTNLASRPITG